MRRLILLLCLLFPLAVTAQGAHWVWIGDSITDGGWGRSGGSLAPSQERNLQDQHHHFGHSYMIHVAAEMQSRYPEREYRCSNRASAGTRSRSWRSAGNAMSRRCSLTCCRSWWGQTMWIGHSGAVDSISKVGNSDTVIISRARARLSPKFGWCCAPPL